MVEQGTTDPVSFTPLKVWTPKKKTDFSCEDNPTVFYEQGGYTGKYNIRGMANTFQPIDITAPFSE